MLIKDLLTTSTQSLKRNRSRSVLTVLGIVIGVMAVILTLSIGQSAEGMILGQVADLGSDLVFAEPSNGGEVSGPPDPFIAQSIDMDDAKALEATGLFSSVSPVVISTVPGQHDDISKFLQIDGITPEYLDIFPADVALGRFIDQSDVETYARVVVLGKEAAEDFFGNNDSIGEKLELNRVSFRVIGIMEEQGTRFFQNLDSRIAVPLTTAQRDLLGVDYVNYISMRALGDVEVAKEEAVYTLRDTHNIDNPEKDLSKDDFIVSTQSDAVETIGVIGTVLTVLLSSIAAISLLVGGIGIMNIMLVSVTERTREIGLRKSVGASEKEILNQFLLEAVFLTGAGGVIGVIVGVAISIAAAHIIASYIGDWGAVVPPEAIFLGVAVSSIIGIVFGYYPARRAARMDPIEALRYE
jgi:putative ABC transport system permease protein